ncbi:MAG TPA: hypothetical protein VD793_04885 [Gemmatimonadales bacterium]|nr:hypothetical protein [Gemmatimonadales bacterium]
MSVAELEIQGEALHQELGREYYLTGAGLKLAADFEAIYARYPTLVSEEALAAARASGSPALLEWIIGLRVGRAVARTEARQLAWEQSAAVRWDGKEVPYLRVPIELANLEDRRARMGLDRARATMVSAGVTRIRQEWMDGERHVMTAAGFPDYTAAVSVLSGIDLRALAVQAEQFLDRTVDLYREALLRVVRQSMSGVPLADLVRSDAAWLFRARAFDAAFPGGSMLPVANRQMSELGLSTTQGGRVVCDVEERPAKQPRAFCVPVRVPDEVYLVIRPRGGHTDYRTFWHELGHAIHYALVDPAHSFAARWLGDNSVTEGFAMLWDHMTVDHAWLRRYGGLSRPDADRLTFEFGVYELYAVRRYAAKLGYEMALYGQARDAPSEYADRLSRATLFRCSPDDYLVDVDPWFYAARYLRAWQFEAAMAEALIGRFDEDWFRNPQAGPHLASYMCRGQAAPADALALEATGSQLSFDPLVRRLERLLG